MIVFSSKPNKETSGYLYVLLLPVDDAAVHVPYCCTVRVLLLPVKHAKANGTKLSHKYQSTVEMGRRWMQQTGAYQSIHDRTTELEYQGSGLPGGQRQNTTSRIGWHTTNCERKDARQKVAAGHTGKNCMAHVGPLQ